MTRFAIFLVGCVIAFGSPALAADCPGPYRVQNSSGNCVWSCGQGTRPDPAGGVCKCQAGLAKTGQDQFGRLTCAKPATSTKKSGVKKKVKRYGRYYPFNKKPLNICTGFEKKSEPDWPIRCKIRPAKVKFRALRPMELIVRRGKSMRAEEFVPGSYQFEFAQPKPPKRNANCNSAVTGVAGACDPKCERLEVYGFYDDGQMAQVRFPDHNERGRCDGVVTMPYRISKPTRARAWDACVDAAEERGLPVWGHDAAITIPRRVAADFGFGDARTTQTSTGWTFSKRINHMIREAYVDLPLIVHCRP